MTKSLEVETSLSQPATFYLQLFADNRLLAERPLARKCAVMIGTAPRCEWRVNHPGLLPQHLCITEHQGQFLATATAQTDVSLDDTVMAKGRAYVLLPGQRINLGSCQMQLSKYNNADLPSAPSTADTQLFTPHLFTPHLFTPHLFTPHFAGRQHTSAAGRSLSAACYPRTVKRQITLLVLCLLLPLISYFMLLPSIKTVSAAAPVSRPTLPSLLVLPAAQAVPASAPTMIDGEENNSNSATAPTTVTAAVTAADTHAPSDHEILITPTRQNGPGRQQPYGLAAPQKRADHYEATISAAAELHNLDPNLLKAVIHAESSFNPFAVSSAGAQGLMQIMPATAADLALDDPFHPGNNIMSGSKLLRRLLDKYQQNVSLALAAYNAGEYAVAKYQGVPPFKETQNYLQKVHELRIHYRAEQAERLAANISN